jgi:RecJ-like exonuclease
VCNGTGKVEVYEDWSLGFAEEKVRAGLETILIECRICGDNFEKEDMYYVGAYYICEDCNQQYMEKWPKKEKAE